MIEMLYELPSEPPLDYNRPPEHDGILYDRDVRVVMRDGVELVIDVYRPEAPGPFPVLLAFGYHSKELQGLALPGEMPPQPAWSSLWVGHMEAGDTRYFVSRGYVHVVGSARGLHKSGSDGSREWDSFDLVDWITQQAWCDGNVGMIGIGAFAAEQYFLAKQGHPALKAIFPFDGVGALGPFGSFREEYPGGVLHNFRYLLDHFSGAHGTKGPPAELTPEKEALWRTALENPDFRMNLPVLNLLNQKGQHVPEFFNILLDPFEAEGAVNAGEASIRNISVPTFCGSGWHAYTYKTHLTGAVNYFALLDCPKRAVFTGPTHLDRPLRALRPEMLRWYDHWLKQMDNGAMAAPPVRYWVSGANRWCNAATWPPENMVWTNLYLDSWERLTPKSHARASVNEELPPDSFVQMPPTLTNSVSSLRYLTDPLPADVLVAGPVSLTLFASIDQTDTNWIVTIKDVGPDVGIRSARAGEREIAADLHEHEVTRGWLKASNRALDEARSTPGRPWHKLTRSARRDVVPGEVIEYAVEIMPTAHLFRNGHRICVEIASMDFPSGVSGATDVEYIPHHICSSRTTVHHIFRDGLRPSRLTLPVLKEDPKR